MDPFRCNCSSHFYIFTSEFSAGEREWWDFGQVSLSERDRIKEGGGVAYKSEKCDESAL